LWTTATTSNAGRPASGASQRTRATTDSFIEEYIEEYFDRRLLDLSPNDYERFFNESNFTGMTAELKIEFAKDGMSDLEPQDVSDVDSFLDMASSRGAYIACISTMQTIIEEGDLLDASLSEEDPEMKIVVRRDDLLIGWGSDKDEPEAWEAVEIELGHRKKKKVWKQVYFDSIEDDIDVEEKLALFHPKLPLEENDAEDTGNSAAA
jgi:hypothetical protein